MGQGAKLGGEIVEMDSPIERVSKAIKEMPAALAERLGIGKKTEPSAPAADDATDKFFFPNAQNASV